MTIFKRDRAIDDMRKRAEGERRTAGEIEALAIKVEDEALAKADAIFSDAMAEHERDLAGYKFECRRWGDFLSLFVERVAKTWQDTEYRPQTYATSVNIRETRELRLVCGSKPDRTRSLKYHVNLRSDSGGSSGWGTGCGRGSAPEGYHYHVWPDYPSIPTQRPLFLLDDPPGERRNYLGMGDYQLRHVTPNYPRPAEDDKIRFEGIGATLFAPAGRGRDIYETILREIGDYTTQKDRPPTVRG